MEEQVLLVDQHDAVLGAVGKLEAHEKGLLHRAFSVFIFDRDGNLLMQRRAAGKYHSAGLWANTCCGHPRPAEALESAARRRLREEMGIACQLEHQFHFVYHANFQNGLQEHEVDHVFFGQCDAPPIPNAEEVQEWRYTSLADLDNELQRSPERFTAWLITCWPRIAGLRGLPRP